MPIPTFTSGELAEIEAANSNPLSPGVVQKMLCAAAWQQAMKDCEDEHGKDATQPGDWDEDFIACIAGKIAAFRQCWLGVNP